MIPAIFLWLGINAVQAQTRLSIEDCRRMALENSDDIKISSRKVGTLRPRHLRGPRPPNGG